MTDQMTQNSVVAYLIQNTDYLMKVRPTHFTMPIHKAIIALAQEYNKEYNTRILDYTQDAPSVGAAIDFAKSNEKLLGVYFKDEDPLPRFAEQIKDVASFDLMSYEPASIKKTTTSFIKWSNYKEGLVGAVTKAKSIEVNPYNVESVINDGMKLMRRGAGVIVDSDMGVSVHDAAAHRQPYGLEVYKSGFTSLDTLIGGGFLPGEMYAFLGETNIGKSIWLANVAQGFMLNGLNVLLASLEMKTERIIKRMGANMFDVSMDEYNEFSQNKTEVQNNLDNWRSSMITPPGELIVKRFSGCTPYDLANFVMRAEEYYEMKFHVVVLDYLGEMNNPDVRAGEYYAGHKENVKALYDMAIELDLSLITAHQINRSGFGLADLTMSNVAESAAALYKLDYVLGIIQTADMRMDKMYTLKAMKVRDSAFKDHYASFAIDYSRMRISDMGSIETPENYIV